MVFRFVNADSARGAISLSKNLFWLTEGQWQRVEPHLPSKVGGKKRKNDRRVISGIIH
jgi:hypothetical protein